MKSDDLPETALVVESDRESPQLTHLQHVHKRMQVHQTFWSKIHQYGRDDDKFIAGDQWPSDIKEDREADSRPVLTYNLLPAFCRQITNKLRQERSQAKIIPVDSGAGGKQPTMPNASGSKDYSVAKILSGLYRNIEQVSRADQAYDTAGKHAVDHGFGWFYLHTMYDPRDPFVQTMRIMRCKDSYMVTADPDSQEADYRDAQDGFRYQMIHKSTFEKKWPDANAASHAHDGGMAKYWFTDGDGICVANYYFIEYKDDEVVKLSNGKTVWLSQVEDILDELEDEQGIHILEQPKEGGEEGEMEEIRKKVKRPVCMMQKMTYSEILEGPNELPFSAIPLFFVSGEEVVIEGEARYESAIRHAKGAQMSYNYWRSSAAEAVALAPKAPYIATSKQISGHPEWDDANAKNYSVLEYTHQEGVSAPRRDFPTGMASAELANARADADDIQAIIGLHDASMGADGNEKSGKAILARQQQGNTSTFQFPDNMTRAQEQCARLAVEAMPVLFDTPRMMRALMPDDSEEFFNINQPVLDKDTNKRILMSDVAVGLYDVTMETGPSYATQRQEAADLQMKLLEVLGPDRAANIVHIIVKNLGVPGSDEVYEILRKLLPDHLKTNEEREADLPKGITLDEQGQMVDGEGQPWQPEPTRDQILQQKAQELEDAKIAAEQAVAQSRSAVSENDVKKAEINLAITKSNEAKAQFMFDQKKLELEMNRHEGEAPAGEIDMAEITRIIQESFEQHEQSPNAHQEATAGMVTDAMKRLQAYVKKMVPDTETRWPNDRALGGAPEIQGDANVVGVEFVYGEGGRMTGASTVEKSNTKSIKFNYDESGRLISAGKVNSLEEKEASTDE